MIPYDKLKRAYQTSPMWLQQSFAAIPFSWRSGAMYRRAARLIKDTEYLPAEQLRKMQVESLRELLVHCHDNVPYYRNAMDALGIDPRDVGPESWFRNLPLLDKSTIAAKPEEFLAIKRREPAYRDNTGGSSGTPLGFWKSNSMYPKELAYMNAQWARVGYRPGDRKITLRGRTFVGRSTDERIAYNAIYNELILSTYHLDAETLRSSAHKVKAFRPLFIHGYPSAIVEYLQVLQEAGTGMPGNIKAVFCGSEPLYPYQRQFIESVLGCPCYSWYGQSECVLLGGECSFSQDYHMFPLYGLMELVDESGVVIDTPGIEGEIVGTALNNFAMPFIRYRTGDRGVLAEGACACGRQYPRLRSVTGRKQHFVYTVEGTAVPVTAFIFGQHFAAFERMRGVQLVQDVPGELLIRIVRDPSFTQADEYELRRKMQDSVDQKMAVSIQYVDRLPFNSAGKVDFVIQNVCKSKPVRLSARGPSAAGGPAQHPV